MTRIQPPPMHTDGQTYIYKGDPIKYETIVAEHWVLTALRHQWTWNQ